MQRLLSALENMLWEGGLGTEIFRLFCRLRCTFSIPTKEGFIMCRDRGARQTLYSIFETRQPSSRGHLLPATWEGAKQISGLNAVTRSPSKVNCNEILLNAHNSIESCVCSGYRIWLFLQFLAWILEMLRQCGIFFSSYFMLGSYNADEGGTLGITMNLNMFLPEGAWRI